MPLALYVGALVLAGNAACGKPTPLATGRAPADEISAAVVPATFARALKKMGGAHVHGTAHWRISPKKASDPDETPQADAVTTTTDLWMDAAGQFRLVETNDRDGGREVVLYEHALSVGLRFGKLTRRPAQEPEPTAFLQEAVGAPAAAWDVVRRFAHVEPAEPSTSPSATPAGRHTFRVRARPAPLPAGPQTPDTRTALRQWRETINVSECQGEVQFDDKTSAPLAFTLKARFTLQRDGEPLYGELQVTTAVDGIGDTAAIAPPASEDLRLRQRTVLEERALLAPGKGTP